MIVSKEHRLEIYNYLYKEGVLVSRKNFQAPRHPNIPAVTNLEVIQLMKGFTSKGLVRENFAWRHYYWYLTNEGINYLREYLNIPSNYVPATLKAESKLPKPIQRSTVGPRREPRFSDRSQYRAEERRIPQAEQPQEEQPGAERFAGATRGRGFSRGRGGARGGGRDGGRGGARFGAPRQE